MTVEPEAGALRRTPLFHEHERLGARLVPFAGFEMPVQYAGVIAEHQAVRQSAGVFDVSHMGEFEIRGPQALDFLNWALTNDASKLKVGRAQYTMLPNKRGGLVDDTYLYRPSGDHYLLVVNASNVRKDWDHLQVLSKDFDVQLTDRSDDTALLAVQGPQAEALLATLTADPLNAMRKNDVRQAQVSGRPALLARTGYTGEDGFEVFCAPADAEPIWQAVLAAGATPAGLGARDTLRLEAGYPLYGHELNDDQNPLETPFGFAIKLGKPFFGREAMQARPLEHRLAGLVLEGRGVPREGYPVLDGEETVTSTTSGTLNPTDRRGIALAYLPLRLAEPGTTLALAIREARVPARVTLPSFRRAGEPA
ncbi:MAG TPA: glycine cleavage system aminomethyltransferase GcvT [Deinococcales bacterium]|nr:glycine cleavage system aminomethyltransferase GcvT [Deinococcales bacterium]